MGRWSETTYPTTTTFLVAMMAVDTWTLGLVMLGVSTGEGGWRGHAAALPARLLAGGRTRDKTRAHMQEGRVRLCLFAMFSCLPSIQTRAFTWARGVTIPISPSLHLSIHLSISLFTRPVHTQPHTHTQLSIASAFCCPSHRCCTHENQSGLQPPSASLRELSAVPDIISLLDSSVSASS